MQTSTRVIFYVRRNGLISTIIEFTVPYVYITVKYFTSLTLSSVKIYSFKKGSICQAGFYFAPSKLIIQTLIVEKCSKIISLLFAL